MAETTNSSSTNTSNDSCLTHSIDVLNCEKMLKELYPTSRFALQTDRLPLHITSSMLEKMVTTFTVINESINTFKTEEISLSYNGGKDCNVLLVLLDSFSRWFLPSTHPSHDLLRKITTLYFHHPNTFQEVTEFVEVCTKKYQLQLRVLHSGFRNGLQEVKETTLIKGIFMGTRRTDPYSNFLSPFAPTDNGWPSFVRILPILDWDYPDVWSLLLDLNIDYCPLYDKGFTSIGYTHDTEPNPALKIPGGDEKYSPAWTLINSSVERHGRTPKTTRAES